MHDRLDRQTDATTLERNRDPHCRRPLRGSRASATLDETERLLLAISCQTTCTPLRPVFSFFCSFLPFSGNIEDILIDLSLREYSHANVTDVEINFNLTQFSVFLPSCVSFLSARRILPLFSLAREANYCRLKTYK